AKELASKIGYPVLIKAAAGGGGRGIRIVNSEDELEAQITAAKQEALSFFSDDAVYLEKFIERPRHVEIQIAADKHGNVVYLGERDCSLQRRHQKVLEESPSPVMTEELRAKMGQAAVQAAKVSNYYNVGTIEFLVDKNNDFYFMEMNTRIQVEHPVTEFVTGVDLVKTQIKIADGQELDFTQDDISVKGHSIECRINAECPEKNFRPCPGVISVLYTPGGPGIRVDSAVYQGYTITPYYDSMISKLIVYGKDRQEAIMKMKWALSEFIVGGIDTNIDFQLELIKSEGFEKGNYDVGFIEDFLSK
ncbi:MAG: ATP-grasp domain-containing protein, partial [Oscillospiraceae bacterium]|nr:ATP-grasp domain-containing protein [Oscillospiraceae bacterium]